LDSTNSYLLNLRHGTDNAAGVVQWEHALQDCCTVLVFWQPIQTVRKLVQNLLLLREVLRPLSPGFGINCSSMVSLTGWLYPGIRLIWLLSSV